jgi:hypothetical protein
MEALGLTLGALVIFGKAIGLFLLIFLPCWVLARLGKGYKRWERRQRESEWSIKLIPD